MADEFEARDGRPRFVAGALGPTNKTLSLSPDVNDPGFLEIDFDYTQGFRLYSSDVYRDQIDTLNAKAAIKAAIEAGEALGRDLPIILSMTLTDLSGRNLSGHTVETFWHAGRHAKPVTIGLNCSFGAEQLRPHVKTLAALCDMLVMVYPNAGLPNELGAYDEMPETTRRWARNGPIRARSISWADAVVRCRRISTRSPRGGSPGWSCSRCRRDLIFPVSGKIKEEE